MDTREVNIILRKKARTELTILRKQLLAQSPQAVLDRAYEYATKSDTERAQPLLPVTIPLAVPLLSFRASTPMIFCIPSP